jgi:hypothetical protein
MVQRIRVICKNESAEVSGLGLSVGSGKAVFSFTKKMAGFAKISEEEVQKLLEDKDAFNIKTATKLAREIFTAYLSQKQISELWKTYG